MAVEKGDHIFVDYTGTLGDGTVFDSSEGKEPLEFDAGAGQMIKGFDDAVIGMKKGETKSVTIAAKDAYGERSEDNVIGVSLTKIRDAGIIDPKVGDVLSMSGQPVKIVSIDGGIVRVDANHPLAGKDLTFKIKVVDIRKK
ncbi:MAG: peptidylprolyl isomerase [Candidatus Aenigmarchaeota archaeon]|nr:peptidylprolyl isomerase [Candidatus Aenigmarchaeota archaeon]